MSATEERRVLERARVAERRRAALRCALRTLPQRLLAGLVGVSRGSLRKFLEGSTPSRVARMRIREWCADRPEPDTAPGAVALHLLTSEFRAIQRGWARRCLVEFLIRLHEESGQHPQPWLMEERGPQNRNTSLRPRGR
jgi:transcriptional regulator with XRE-family HTH domain